jgi:hypothetical protein
MTKPECSGANLSWTVANTCAAAGVILCVALSVFVQWQLFRRTSVASDGRVGSALWHWMVERRVPQDASHMWYQLNAAIPKVGMEKLPGNVVQRAGPVIDWLAGSGGLQRGTIARILLDGDNLLIDVYNIDALGCTRIMMAARSGHAPVDSIAVTGSNADMIPVSASTPGDDQCSRSTNFLRTLSLSHH